MLCCGDVINFYDQWPDPIVIMSDGPYGVSGYDGDLSSANGLAEWYEPHIKIWSQRASPLTTLWFWNTELGWAETHPVLKENGWVYRCCNIWDKGMAHVAGNVNTQTLRKFPIVSEVCVQYVREPKFRIGEQDGVSAQDWLRSEWKRTGLPWNKANEACGVKNAATRKYLTADHLWYFPPAEVFEKLTTYANQHGDPAGKPYFAIEGKELKGNQWEQLRGKFYCPVGVTNVWSESAVHGNARKQSKGKTAHPNQKPYNLIKQIVLASSDKEDVVWEPFGGLMPTYLVGINQNRQVYSAEIDKDTYDYAKYTIDNVVNLKEIFEC